MGADFYNVADQVKNVLGATPLAMVLTNRREDDRGCCISLKP